MDTDTTSSLVDVVRNAGVVGAGGAGFPTYAKIDTPAEIVIANGAECEPLLFKDQTIIEQRPAEVIEGLTAVMRHVGASRGIIAIKGKNRSAIGALEPHLRSDIGVFEMEDTYPAGDEYEIVYHVTGKRIPAGGYPTDIGILVQNVETLYNIHRAKTGHAVTHSMVTIHGHLARPCTAWIPIGTSYRDALDIAGGPTIRSFALIDGGPMMGVGTTDLRQPVTRTTSGITVISRDSALAVRKAQTQVALKRVAKSACDQCSLCTEMCPRYLLGYPIQPHLVMRSLLLSGTQSRALTHWAQQCSECGVCSLWACPEQLDPKAVCVACKSELRREGTWLSPTELQKLTGDVHPLKGSRSVPTARLTRRLGLAGFTAPAPFATLELKPKSVAIPLSQHAGIPAVAAVSVGDMVEVGDVIGRAAHEGLSVPVHASIDGIVLSVGDRIVIERA